MSAPRPDLLAALPGCAAESIRAVLPQLRDCRGIAGRLNLDEVKRRGINAPAVLVSRLGARQVQALAGPLHVFEVSMAAFVVTRDAVGLPREDAAQAITAALLRLVPENTWRQVGVGPAEKVAEQALATTDTEKSAISLWAVTWVQNVTLQDRPAPGEIAPELYLGQAPLIGAAHEADYERIGAAEEAQPVPEAQP